MGNDAYTEAGPLFPETDVGEVKTGIPVRDAVYFTAPFTGSSFWSTRKNNNICECGGEK